MGGGKECQIKGREEMKGDRAWLAHGVIQPEEMEQG